jgi:predicted DNA binding CopG/RHH family protein
MRKEYDFSNARPGRFSDANKTPITIRVNNETLDYFKALSSETGVPYQTLINFYLNECARNRKRLAFMDEHE